MNHTPDNILHPTSCTIEENPYPLRPYILNFKPCPLLSPQLSPPPSEVFVAAIPLVGLEALGAALGELYPGRLEHTMVLVYPTLNHNPNTLRSHGLN